jgi:polysaccharide pyruvyl transferase WcaK-like protein
MVGNKFMKKYLLYGHGGSENHGCEALVRTTVNLLNVPRENIFLSSYEPAWDEKYGIENICCLHKRKSKKLVPKFTFGFLKAYFKLKFLKETSALDELYELNSLGVKKGDIAISIGGDSYCYGETNYLRDENDMFRKAKIKTVLWGCSIEPELLEKDEIAEDIRKFDLITARESISYSALKKLNKNTVLVCDSAFHLAAKELDLPKEAQNCDLVGINASPMVEDNESEDGITRINFRNLIEKILHETDFKILLIPHVIWRASDDRTVLSQLYEKYAYTQRVFLVKDCNCEELKGYIARCRFFIGARTHSTIAAYSSCVPTLTVGYSVKAKGIAKDLFGTDDNYVVPVQSLTDPYTLANAFEWLLNNESYIKDYLHNIMPDYKKLIDCGLSELKKL